MRPGIRPAPLLALPVLALPLLGVICGGLVLVAAEAMRLWPATDRWSALRLGEAALVSAGLALAAALPTLSLAPVFRAALLVPLVAGMGVRQAGLALVPMPAVLAAALLVLPVAVGVLWWFEPASLAADLRAASVCGAGRVARLRRIVLPARLPGILFCLLACAALAAGVLGATPPG